MQMKVNREMVRMIRIGFVRDLLLLVGVAEVSTEPTGGIEFVEGEKKKGVRGKKVAEKVSDDTRFFRRQKTVLQ
jgi:hypothetical protein